MDWLLALFVLAVGALVWIAWTGLVQNWRPRI
jgi:hypothetical protein